MCSFQVIEVIEATGLTDPTEATGPTDQTRVATTRAASTATLARTETSRSARLTGRPVLVSEAETLRPRGSQSELPQIDLS